MITQREMIAVLDAGAASLKFSVYQVSHRTVNLIASGACERMASTLRFHATDSQGVTIAEDATPLPAAFEHADAFHILDGWLRKHFGEEISLSAVGHKITHGGEEFADSTFITSEVLEHLEALIPLAPLHQPHNLAAIRAVHRLWPDMPQVACFDTAFHRHRPRVAERFALPTELFDRGLKRWGFHGLAYESVAAGLSRVAPRVVSGRLIIAHLDDNVSICAMKGGRSIDTTTGFSTLDGLPMGTRCGSLDPSAILHLMREMSFPEIETLLCEHSGLLGISGISGDLRVLLESNDPRAAEAIDYFVYRVVREIASLTAALGALDALVFTASIGQHSALIRARICSSLLWLGVAIDCGANQRGDTCMSPPGRSPSVWVIPANEHAVIARHTWRIASMLPHRISRERGMRNERVVQG